MKGLIYKELFLGKKTYLGLLAVALGLALLGILVGLGIRYGNIQDMAADEVTSMFQMFVYFTYGILLFTIGEDFFAIERDKVKGWRKLEYTMPVTAKKQMAARYLTAGIVLIGCFVLGLVNAGAMALMFRRTFTATMFKNMVIILLLVMVLFLAGMPQYQRFSSRTVTFIYSVILSVLVIGSTVISIKEPEILEVLINSMVKNVGRFVDGFLYLSPIIMPVLFAVSFFLSVKAYQRREK
ncbi:MAG: ABC-2 transporter permease [Lachnospiraceae bacterium]|nr:ABC-2 transporter permease [Lachnospiraceae bacterium]